MKEVWNNQADQVRAAGDEAPRREITSVAVGADGTVYAASVGGKSHNPLPPLPVQGTGVVTFNTPPGAPPLVVYFVVAKHGTEILGVVDGAAITLTAHKVD